MNTIHKGVVITAEQIASWLDASNDEEFGEAIVLFWKKYNGDQSHICKKDFKEFNITAFVDWIKDILEETVPIKSEFNRTAWWKE